MGEGGGGGGMGLHTEQGSQKGPELSSAYHNTWYLVLKPLPYMAGSAAYIRT